MTFCYPENAPFPQRLFDQAFLHQNTIKLEPSQCLFHEGDTHSYIYLLISGWVILEKRLMNDQRQVLDIALSGALIGYTTEYDSSVDYTATTITRSQLYRIEKARFLDVLLTSTMFSKHLIAWQQQRNQYYHNQLLVIGQAQARHKVAHFFLGLVRRLERRGITLEENMYVPLERQEIADAVGITTVHLSRVIMEFRLEKILHHSRDYLTIYNIKALQKVARFIDHKI